MSGCQPGGISPSQAVEAPRTAEMAPGPVRSVIESAFAQTKTTTGYTQNYFVIPYPNGDVPADTGACTDVVIRAFRAAGVDLQKEVHEDMAANFSEYPKKWGLSKTDTNIDHRRVPNLQKYFERRGKSLQGAHRGARDDAESADVYEANDRFAIRREPMVNARIDDLISRRIPPMPEHEHSRALQFGRAFRAIRRRDGREKRIKPRAEGPIKNWAGPSALGLPPCHPASDAR